MKTSKRIVNVSSISRSLVAILCLLTLAAGTSGVLAAQFKIMTYNIADAVGQNNGYNSTAAQKIARIINYYQPDIIALNELEGSNSTLVENNVRLWVNNYLPYLGGQPGVTYHTYICPLTDGYNVNGIISRYPINDRIAQNLDPRGLMSGTIDLPGPNDVRVFNCHLKAYSDSASANRRQQGAATAASRIISWSGTAATASIAYVLCGDMNEDEENPQTPLTSTYHPITTLLSAYLVNYKPNNGYGNTKTISSSSPTRRFDYILPSWHLEPIWGQIIDTNQMFLHGQLPPGLQRLDSQASDHLSVCALFNIRENTIPSVLTSPDGPTKALSGKTCTAAFGESFPGAGDAHFYLEETNRSSAIRIDSAANPPVGSIVNVKGSASGAGGERKLANTEVRIITTSGNPLQPLFFRGDAIGGSSLNQYTPGVDEGVGVYNIGLYIKSFGKVTSVHTGYFMMTDGSAAVRVNSTKNVSVNQYVLVSGIVGYYIPYGKSSSIRVIKTRSADDVQIISQ